ncbi:MAG: hypothetical protein RSC93_00760 [Erysipelotrichaceae bacterium]
MKKAKVTDHNNLLRMDGVSITNTDNEAYKRAKTQREKAKQNRKNLQRIEELETKVNGLENKLDTIILLLQKGT